MIDISPTLLTTISTAVGVFIGLALLGISYLGIMLVSDSENDNQIGYALLLTLIPFALVSVFIYLVW